jgi:DNA gyrase subunit A
VREKKVEGISDIRDESDREQSVRIVIELKRDAIAQVVLNNLYALTPMQTTFGILMLAIDQGQPRTMSLKEVLEKFILHRREVVTRRSRYELRKALARLHIVEGLLVAQDMIDHVISIIRKSVDVDEARWGLMNVLSPALYENARFGELPRLDLEKARAQMAALVARARGEVADYRGLSRSYEGTGFSEEQSKNILEMRLQRLTGMQREELFKEMVELLKEISKLEDILANESSLLRVIKAELADIQQRYGDERRTEIVALEGELSAEDLIADEPMVVTVSHAGYVKRTPLSEYRVQGRGGRGRTGTALKDDDFVQDVFVASTHAYLMPITTKGKLYWLKVHEIPLASPAAKGKPIVNLVQLAPDEKLASILITREFSENKFVFFATRKGIVKRTDLTAFSNVRSAGIIALGIDDGDSLVAVRITDGTKDVVLATAQGMSIRFNEAEVRSMGRTAFGVKGITLEDGDEVVGADVVEKNSTILTVTENGYGKRTEEGEYRVQGRGGKGIIDIKTSDRNGRVAGLVQVKDGDELMLLTSGGVLIRIPAKDVSVIGRNTQGVRLITLDKAEEKVASLSALPEVNLNPEAVAQASAPAPAGESNGSADNVPGDAGDVPGGE